MNLDDFKQQINKFYSEDFSDELKDLFDNKEQFLTERHFRYYLEIYLIPILKLYKLLELGFKVTDVNGNVITKLCIILETELSDHTKNTPGYNPVIMIASGLISQGYSDGFTKTFNIEPDEEMGEFTDWESTDVMDDIFADYYIENIGTLKYFLTTSKDVIIADKEKAINKLPEV